MSMSGVINDAINDATTEIKYGNFFRNIAFLISAMGTNDIQKNGKFFEEKIKEEFSSVQFSSVYLFCASKRKIHPIYVTKKIFERTGRQRNDHTVF